MFANTPAFFGKQKYAKLAAAFIVESRRRTFINVAPSIITIGDYCRRARAPLFAACKRQRQLCSHPLVWRCRRLSLAHEKTKRRTLRARAYERALASRWLQNRTRRASRTASERSFARICSNVCFYARARSLIYDRPQRARHRLWRRRRRRQRRSQLRPIRNFCRQVFTLDTFKLKSNTKAI